MIFNENPNLLPSGSIPQSSWPVVVSFGGGTNSAAMLIEMARCGVKPDLIMFADTGGEFPETYEFVSAFSAWLVANGMPEVLTVRSTGKTLEEDCIDRHTLPSVAFGFKTCSQRWKTQPQDKYLNKWEPAREAWRMGGKVVKLIGYDADESHRIKDYDSQKYVVAYPLVSWGWGRKRCKETVASTGFRPAKSACYFCPNARPHEVLALAKSHPELMQRVQHMEANANLTQVKGLGRSWAWSDLVAAEAAQLKLFDDLSDSMPCGCYDGEGPDFTQPLELTHP
jgi:hypothetical protein